MGSVERAWILTWVEEVMFLHIFKLLKFFQAILILICKVALWSALALMKTFFSFSICKSVLNSPYLFG